MAGGTIISLAQMGTLSAVAREHGISVHLDGARILNACVAEDVALLGSRGSVIRDPQSEQGTERARRPLVCGTEQLVDEARINLNGSRLSATGRPGPGRSRACCTADDDPQCVRTTGALESSPEGWRTRTDSHRPGDRPDEHCHGPTRRIFHVHAEIPQRIGSRVCERITTCRHRRFVLHRHITDDDVARVIDVVRDLVSRA